MFDQIVEYDRSAREYRFTDSDGVIYSAPPGAENKRKLFLTWLELEHPATHALALKLAESNPHALRFIWRGAEMAASGAVTRFDVPRGINNTVALVASQSDHFGEYAISLDSHGMKNCNCPYFVEGEPLYIALSSGDVIKTCKHLIAHYLVNVLESEY